MACIYFHSEAYSTDGPKLMGRNAAGESFLRGFFAYSQPNLLWAYTQNDTQAQLFIDKARSFNRNEAVELIGKGNLSQLSSPGVLYYPGPDIARQAWERAAFGHAAWSLCGITHTTSSASAMDAITELITAPIQPWDALICTSLAVKRNVERVLQSQMDYLKERLGASTAVLPQLPVIPLGIHTSDFAFDASLKRLARKKMSLADDALIVLYMGRLSFHAKAHPLAMYQALERAANRSGKNVVLVECGWHANPFIAKAYAEAAQLACPSVKTITLDGRIAENRQMAWASADVFCSLSDNIQETFGLAPIEAMAAGLPVVVSDWDGYKDTVRDGLDGFRIPTVMPDSGMGGDLARRHALEIDNYDQYCGYACSFVGIDVILAADAFTKLFESPALRQRMGLAGQERARGLYDWKVIIPQYEALWAEQNRMRKSEPRKNQAMTDRWPARMDPFFSFADYSTRTLKLDSRFLLVDSDLDTALNRIFQYRQLTMVDYAKLMLPTDAEIRQVLLRGFSGSTTAQELMMDIPLDRRPLVLRSLAWLVKLGILTYEE